MKITFKKFAYYPRMSEETNCFVADLYVDGKKRGVVKNDGKGGDTRFSDREIQTALDAYGKTLPPEHKYGLVYDSELLVDTEVERLIIEQEDKKVCKRGIAFTEPGKPRAVSSYKIPYTAENVRWVMSKHPSATILNTKFGPPKT